MKNQSSVVGFFLRLLASVVVIALTTFLVPGMRNKGGFGALVLAALAIALIQHILDSVFGLSRSAKGLTGFLVTALILYITGKIVDGFTVSVMGALIGGLLFGLVNALIPGNKLHK